MIQIDEIELIISEVIQIDPEKKYEIEYNNIMNKLNSSDTLIHYLILNKTIHVVSEDENYLYIFRNGISFILENLKVILETE